MIEQNRHIISPEEICNHPHLSKYFLCGDIGEFPELNKHDHSNFVIPIVRTKNNNPIKFEYLREIFGINPNIAEPCFYNQDWYLNEKFYTDSKLEEGWLSFPGKLNAKSRGTIPNLDDVAKLPTALSVSYFFLMVYVLRDVVLWEHDYIWCKDLDANGDRIYVGRYFDPKGVNKNGFSIHRHLSITNQYGVL